MRVSGQASGVFLDCQWYRLMGVIDVAVLRICKTDEVPSGTMKQFDLQDGEVLLVNLNSQFYGSSLFPVGNFRISISDLHDSKDARSLTKRIIDSDM